MAIVLYDLCGADPDVRFSPHCWKIKMALAHKGLAFETRPTPFTKVPDIGGGFSKTVPVIDDGGRLVRESFDIAVYLEETYPDRPSLFGGEGGRSEAKFIESWALTEVHPLLLTLIVLDIHNQLGPDDQAYFRDSREKRLGKTLEAAVANRDSEVVGFRESLLPLRLALRAQPFLGGARPLYADYALFGSFQWCRCISDFQFLAPDDPIHAWRGRMLDLYDGLAGKAKGYPV
jgi:glutathione S-transferase